MRGSGRPITPNYAVSETYLSVLKHKERWSMKISTHRSLHSRPEWYGAIHGSKVREYCYTVAPSSSEGFPPEEELAVRRPHPTTDSRPKYNDRFMLISDPKCSLYYRPE